MVHRKMNLREKRAKAEAALLDLCRRYGTVKLATLDCSEGKDTLVLISPPMMVSGDIPCIPIVILDPPLWRLCVEAYGSIKVAAAVIGMGEGSSHFTESKQGVK